SHQPTHHTKTKEIRLRPKTGEHDIDFKIKQAKGFLEHKDNVVVSVVFRGRELAHIDEGKKVMDRVVQELMAVGKLEAPPLNQGKRMICTLMPKYQWPVCREAGSHLGLRSGAWRSNLSSLALPATIVALSSVESLYLARMYCSISST